MSLLREVHCIRTSQDSDFLSRFTTKHRPPSDNATYPQEIRSSLMKISFSAAANPILMRSGCGMKVGSTGCTVELTLSLVFEFC